MRWGLLETLTNMEVSKGDLRRYAQELENKTSRTHRETILLKQNWTNGAIERLGKCEKCGRINGLTLDHIIPRELLLQMGIDEDRAYMPENYQLYCKICNTFKGRQLDFANPKTKILLLKYLDNL